MMTYCCYTNRARTPKVIRVSTAGFWLERLVFPGQVILVQVPLGALLEVYGEPVTMVREDSILCSEETAVS